VALAWACTPSQLLDEPTASLDHAKREVEADAIPASRTRSPSAHPLVFSRNLGQVDARLASRCLSGAGRRSTADLPVTIFQPTICAGAQCPTGRCFVRERFIASPFDHWLLPSAAYSLWCCSWHKASWHPPHPPSNQVCFSLVPEFKKASGIDIEVVALGCWQTIDDYGASGEMPNVLFDTRQGGEQVCGPTDL
jgi:hypothetical protein